MQALTPGMLCIFTKSGNEVRLIEPVTGSNPASWHVVRTQGQSAGKAMICLARALQPVDLAAPVTVE